MDMFSRTFLPATAGAGIPIAAVIRHMHVMRHCVEPDDGAVLVTRCARPDRPLSRDYFMVLTCRRLVITQETRLLHQLHLHLNTELRHLRNVVWHPDPHLGTVELAATAVDGIRERFLIKVGHPKHVWRLDALFSYVFKPRMFKPRVIAAQRSRFVESPHRIPPLGISTPRA
jgi:hypothetical protein